MNNEEYYIYRGGGETEDHIYIHVKETDKTLEIPVSLFDELVVMRYPQLVEGLVLEKVQKRAWNKHGGSLGCDALAKIMGKPTVKDLIAQELARKAKKDYVPTLNNKKGGKKKDA